jgi:hypothetical protein
MAFETLSRIITEVPEDTKIWFADYCRRHHTTMSRMVRELIESMQKTTQAQRAETQESKHE